MSSTANNLYYEFYRQCQDSIVKIDQSEEIRRMKSLYDYNLRERENQRLALANERKQASIYRLFAITAILLLFFHLSAFRHHRNLASVLGRRSYSLFKQEKGLATPEAKIGGGKAADLSGKRGADKRQSPKNRGVGGPVRRGNASGFRWRAGLGRLEP